MSMASDRHINAAKNFLELLRFSAREPNAQQIAEVLASTTASLTELGVSHASTKWSQLARSMMIAEPEAALIIFQAMVRTLADESMLVCTDFMRKVMACPGWRLRAIELEPSFFLKHRVGPGPASAEHPRKAANAFQTLAWIETKPEVASYQETQETIRALKAIGVQEFPEPDHRCISLHPAAGRHAPESFRAFVEEFPEHVDAIDISRERPLHYAARSYYPDNVKLLLAAGANPRSSYGALATPLQDAVCEKRDDNARILLATGAYSASDVEVVLRERPADDSLRSFHAALAARQIIDEVGDDAPSSIKPL